MTPAACEAFRAAAPELALGIAVGDERAAALDHLAECADCRRVLEDLTATVDSVLLTAPAAEPPNGFEVRALEAFDRQQTDGPEVGDRVAPPAGAMDRSGGVVGSDATGTTRTYGRTGIRRHPVDAWLVAAVVIALLGLGAAALVFFGADDHPTGYDASHRIEGVLEDPDGTPVGAVWIDYDEVDPHHAGTELVITLDGTAPEGSYRVQCDYASGGPYDAGDLTVGRNGVERWSTEVDVPTYDLTRVRLISADGHENLEAEIPT